MTLKDDARISRPRMLIVHTGGIGDFLLGLPAFERLARGFSLTLLGNPERLGLAVAAGIADVARDLDAVDFHSAFTTPSDRLHAFLKPFDAALIWMRDEDGALRDAFRSCGIARVQCLPGLPDAQWDGHATDYYWQACGFEGDAPLPRLAMPGAPSTGAPDVLIHPGSGSMRKNWPLARFAAVAERLARDGRRVAWLAGPAEAERATAEALPDNARRLSPMPLQDVARTLAAARLYVGNDGGITHLTAAMGTPTVAIFGPTDARVWAPRGEHVRVITPQPGEAWPEVDEVLAAVDGLPG